MYGIELQLAHLLPAAIACLGSADECPTVQHYGPAAARYALYAPAYAVNQVPVPTPPPPTYTVYTPPVFSIGVGIAGRGLDSDSYEPVEHQFAFGFDFVARRVGAGPLGVEFGTLFSGDSAGSLDMAIGELYLGARLTLADLYDTTQPVVPYISAGGTLITADIEQNNLSSSDDTSGYYLRAGIDFLVSPEFSVGIDFRHVGGTDTDFGFAGLGGAGASLDYDQVGINFSFYF